MSHMFQCIYCMCERTVCLHPTAQHVYMSPALYYNPPSPPLHHFVHCLKSLKTFQAFSSLFSSSRQFEEGFLNDPLIIDSGVTLAFQVCLLAFLLPFPPSPLYLPLFFKGLFLLAPHPCTPSYFSLQNGFLVCLFVFMKWNAAKSLRAFFPFFCVFRKPSSMS